MGSTTNKVEEIVETEIITMVVGIITIMVGTQTIMEDTQAIMVIMEGIQATMEATLAIMVGTLVTVTEDILVTMEAIQVMEMADTQAIAMVGTPIITTTTGIQEPAGHFSPKFQA